ncbi:alpha/beta hydrolase [Saccharicrinis fermentans]|uniref:Acetyl esterase n=1 Tax=Saccharicrinis fermentans DSM 9555 = JCM 21142 TaxID=869213 RepID=W7Y352_9BACT|nr:alpha/beta hydrolase [Saccharicrinis fermentans]GAF02013.1 acetyl esterase [Saccharicrinis fermentans DSM 9555 = JCM 21142]
MTRKLILWAAFIFVFISVAVQAQDVSDQLANIDRDRPFKLTYKTVDTVSLDLTFRYPAGFNKHRKYPTMVFFFGGGWNGGSIDQFKPQAEYFASRGMITVLADYRVKSRHKTTPYESVADAKSAIRFLRKNAKVLNINPKKIAASGGSAGGHLAAACGNCPGLDEPEEDLSISSKANALVLFNPVSDNGPDGFCYERMGERWKEISPAHNIRKNAPPTIIFLGKKDHLIPVSIVEKYQNKMKEVGSRCDLFLYDGVGHGFFNNTKHNGEFYTKTVYQSDLFLKSLKFLKGEPTL